MAWFVYLLRCADDTLYCGVTNDLDRRLDRHARGDVKYTRGRLPATLVFSEEQPDRGAALRREAELKRLPRRKKLDLVAGVGRAIGGAALLAAAACGGDVPKPVGFAQINAQVLQPSCAAFSSCHSAAGRRNAGNLDMSSNPYAALVGVDADNLKAQSEGKKRVDPGNLDNSFLWVKLNLTMATDRKTGYGEPMPYASERLPKPQLDGIREWILAGAAND
jgi:putative endonuclease